MSSDTTNTVVIAIQGNAIKAETEGFAQDGYVLTWENLNNQWEAKTSVGLQSEIFTSSGIWTCPPNVFNVWLTGFSGGGGGSGGVGNSPNAQSGGGGGASVMVNCPIPVMPGTMYQVIIGAGGLGGSGGNLGSSPGDGGSVTEFYVYGSVTAMAICPGGGGASGVGNSNLNYVSGGLNNTGTVNIGSFNDFGLSPQDIGAGGCGAILGQYPGIGYPQGQYTGGNGGSGLLTISWIS